MARAVNKLSSLPDYILVDGLPVGGLPCPSTAIVRGDSLSLSIAAASIVAKVVRDGILKEMDASYPRYGFAKHKGYGSAAHIQALLEHGPCPIHRRTFRPVREALEIRRRAEGRVDTMVK
jgi:ribonuclease HII